MWNPFPRLRARARLRDDIGIWYHLDYEVDALADTARVLGLDPRRGEKIVASVTDALGVNPNQIRASRLATVTELTSVHPRSYLERTTQPSYLARIFGLEANDIDVESMLTAQRLQVGATIDAAAWAAEERDRVAFHVGGGFHHAEPESGMGFCVYNDIAIAIAQLRKRGFDENIAIVDLDYHQGNGNIIAFEKDVSVLTYSVHGANWTHIEALNDVQHLVPSGSGDGVYLDTLRSSLPTALRDHQPKLVFYVAGNDVMRGDRLGEFELTGEGVLARDRFVTESVRDCNASMVVTLGGGYSKEAWRPSYDFLRWLLTDDAVVTTVEPENLMVATARIARALSPHDLQRESGDFQITEADLMGDLASPKRQARRVLDYYTKHGVEFALEEYGLMDDLRDRGFAPLRLTVDPSDADRQRLSLHGRKDGDEHLLVELLVRQASAPAPSSMGDVPDLRFLSIEWMMLQNPTEPFSLRRPQLPGQSHPGLGVGERLMNMLLQAAKRLDLDGVSHHPSRYHIAFIGAGQFIFLDPAIQGRFEALRRVLSELDLAEAAWKMERSEIVDDSGEPIVWEPEVCVVPVSQRMFEHFTGAEYQTAKAAAREAVTEGGIRLAD